MACGPELCLYALFAPVMARGPSGPAKLLPFLLICLFASVMARGLSGPTKHLPFLLYNLLLLWRTACPRSERSVGGPARISLMLHFGASRPV